MIKRILISIAATILLSMSVSNISYAQLKEHIKRETIQKSDYAMALIPGKVQSIYNYHFEEVVFKIGCYGSLAATAFCAGGWAINDYKYKNSSKDRAVFAQKASTYRTATAISAGAFVLLYAANYIDAIAAANRARVTIVPTSFPTGEMGVSLAFTF